MKGKVRDEITQEWRGWGIGRGLNERKKEGKEKWMEKKEKEG